jgi:hypothetical protein
LLLEEPVRSTGERTARSSPLPVAPAGELRPGVEHDRDLARFVETKA